MKNIFNYSTAQCKSHSLATCIRNRARYAGKERHSKSFQSLRRAYRTCSSPTCIFVRRGGRRSSVLGHVRCCPSGDTYRSYYPYGFGSIALPICFVSRSTIYRPFSRFPCTTLSHYAETSTTTHYIKKWKRHIPHQNGWWWFTYSHPYRNSRK